MAKELINMNPLGDVAKEAKAIENAVKALIFGSRTSTTMSRTTHTITGTWSTTATTFTTASTTIVSKSLDLARILQPSKSGKVAVELELEADPAIHGTRSQASPRQDLRRLQQWEEDNMLNFQLVGDGSKYVTCRHDVDLLRNFLDPTDDSSIRIARRKSREAKLLTDSSCNPSFCHVSFDRIGFLLAFGDCEDQHSDRGGLCIGLHSSSRSC